MSLGKVTVTKKIRRTPHLPRENVMDIVWGGGGENNIHSDYFSSPPVPDSSPFKFCLKYEEEETKTHVQKDVAKYVSYGGDVDMIVMAEYASQFIQKYYRSLPQLPTFEYARGCSNTKCGGTKFTQRPPEQIRSGDEGSTHFIQCVACGRRIKQ